MSDIAYIQDFINSNYNFFATQGINSVFTMPGHGINSFAEDFYDKISADPVFSNFKIEYIKTRSEEDLETAISKFLSYDKKKYFIISISHTTDDLSKIIKKHLSGIRLDDQGNSRLMIISSPRCLWEVIVEKEFVVTKGRFTLPLIKYDQFLVRFKQLQSRFAGNTIDEVELQKIFSLSGGHGRLLKYLLINFFKGVLNIEDDVEKILQMPDIQMALDDIYRGFPLALWKNIKDNNLKPEIKFFLKELGYIDENSEILIALLKEYIEIYYTKSESNLNPFNLKLSFREAKLFEELTSLQGQIVTRDRACEILWGENWVDEYSDWALSQVILNIRREIEVAKLPFILKTVKGQGFVMIKSSL